MTKTRELLTQTDWPDNRAMHQVLEMLFDKVIDPLEKRLAKLESPVAATEEDAGATDDSPAPPTASEVPPTDLGNSPESPSPVGPADPALGETDNTSADPATDPASTEVSEGSLAG